ncbi:pyridoxal phosphate-dependent aminotransferase [Candidatus Altiarchaeota archaeon]
MVSIASRLDKVEPSATLKYSAMAKKPGVINLTVGRPDFNTPEIIREAAKKALDEGKVHYLPSRGIPELREKIAEKFSSENNISGIDAEKVIVGVGGKQVLFSILLALVDRGDKVAFSNPSWVSYEPMTYIAEGEVVWLPLKPEDGFIPGEEFLQKLEEEKPKLLLINSPNNPTGAVYPEKVLRKIVDVCERNDTWIVSDEVYECLIYEGEHFSPGSIYEKTITVNAFSKTYSMTGWRLGYFACPEKKVVDKVAVIQGQSVTCATSFAQYGGLAAFTPEAKTMTSQMLDEYRKRREYVMERVGGLDCVCLKPSGAFYVFPSFGEVDDIDLADKMLEKGVAPVPGSPFGSRGEGCLRLSYANANVEKLKEAFDRIEQIPEIKK